VIIGAVVRNTLFFLTALAAGCAAAGRSADEDGGRPVSRADLAVLLTRLDQGLADLALPADLGVAPDLLAPADLRAAPDLRPVDNFPVYAHDPYTLYRVDLDTFDLTVVGSFGLGTTAMTDLAMTPTGDLYGVTFTSVYSVDKTTGAATPLVGNVFTATNALTFMPDGTLLGADEYDHVYAISASGVQLRGSYGSGFMTAGDLVSMADGTLFGLADQGPMTTATSNALILVNPSSGAATAVGTITGFVHLYGIAYTRGRLLAFNDQGQIIQIDPATGASMLVKTHPGVAFYGAASNPLAPPVN
jgi:hypothetical protein